jgi:peptidoglycan/LPS O-acetylase OafA/YrhL
MVLTAVHLVALVGGSNPKQRGNWENWSIGVIVVLAVFASVYWLTYTKPGRRWRRKPHE